jgi:hypothetical protein
MEPPKNAKNAKILKAGLQLFPCFANFVFYRGEENDGAAKERKERKNFNAGRFWGREIQPREGRSCFCSLRTLCSLAA